MQCNQYCTNNVLHKWWQLILHFMCIFTYFAGSWRKKTLLKGEDEDDEEENCQTAIEYRDFLFCKFATMFSLHLNGRFHIHTKIERRIIQSLHILLYLYVVRSRQCLHFFSKISIFKIYCMKMAFGIHKFIITGTPYLLHCNRTFFCSRCYLHLFHRILCVAACT